MEVIRYNPYLILENSEKKTFLFVIRDNSIFEIDEKTLKLLELEGKTNEEAYKLVEENMDRNEFNDLYHTMKTSHFIMSDEIIPEENSSEGISANLRGITLMIIQECNLRCTYCYGNGGEYHDKGKMTSEVAKKSIDYLLNYSTNNELLVCFLGGEPLMNFPLIQEVVAYCKLREKDCQKHFKYTITTNGTIWNDEIEKFFRTHNFAVQISVDGAKDIHNCNRFYANGTGSFDIMERNTKKMRDQGLVSGRATITGTNLNVLDDFKALDRLNFKSIPIAPAQNLLSEEEYEQLIDENKRLAMYFEELIKDKKYVTAKKMRIFMSALNKIHKSGTVRCVSCGVGNTQLAVDINGDLYPCHRFVANKEYSMGSVFEATKYSCEDFLKEVSVKNHLQCKNCWAKNLCVGACPNENLVNMKSTQITSKKYCNYVQAMYRELVKIYIDLSIEEKDVLFE